MVSTDHRSAARKESTEGRDDMKGMKKTQKTLFMLFTPFMLFSPFFVATDSAAQSTEAALVLVRIETPHGNIDLEIDTKRAPVTSANFLKYVDAGLYNGGRFHRATRPDNYTPTPPNRPAMELIQGGIDQARQKEGFPAIPLERTSVTGIKHLAGVVSMARGGVDSATSDFFILLDDQPSLDDGGMRFDDGQGAAAFGRVVAGLDVVRKIQQQPVEKQALTPAVKITRMSRVK
jgi:peptidyl-prolyl cis-trans isomerase A (cyclophilin A)